MTAIKPYSEACDENRDPILKVLQQQFRHAKHCLEIGSGTGQHAAYLPKHLPHLIWQPSDVAAHITGIEMWRKEANFDNVLPSVVLDVTQTWPSQHYDAVFSANTAHIMSFAAVTAMFEGVGRLLTASGVFCLYGPFKQNGAHTAESNARFDDFLRQRDPLSGVRDIGDLQALAEKQALSLSEIVEMPVNNKILVFHRSD